jgi:hypothetical protein
MVKYIVEKELDIKSGRILLYTSCKLGYVNITRYLLKAGIDVNNYGEEEDQD